MPWQTTSITERELRLREGISTGLKLAAVPGRASNIGVISAEVAGEIDDLHQHIAYQAKQRFTKTADLENLKNIAAEYGMSQRQAVPATGVIQFDGAESVTLETGTRWKHANGQFYVTTADAIVSGGTATVTAEAEATGPAGNLVAGQELTLVSPVSGIASVATVSPSQPADGWQQCRLCRLGDRYSRRGWCLDFATGNGPWHGYCPYRVL